MVEIDSKYNKALPAGAQFIDVYRVLVMFDVTDPCIQHAVKKLLAAGRRGHKDSDRDIDEAMQSLQRFKDMKIEDQAENVIMADRANQ